MITTCCGLNSNRKSEIVNRKFGCGYAALVMIVEDKINRRYSKQYYQEENCCLLGVSKI